MAQQKEASNKKNISQTQAQSRMAAKGTSQRSGLEKNEKTMDSKKSSK